jgi:hydrogenase nickel incorporation protein HypA/HybF
VRRARQVYSTSGQAPWARSFGHVQGEEPSLHELSIALSLLEGVTQAARREGVAEVRAVHLRIGALSGVSADALTFSWEQASVDTVAAGSRLEIERIPLAVYCEPCGGEVLPAPGTGLLCPACGTPAPSIIRGRELQLVAMEVAS